MTIRSLTAMLLVLLASPLAAQKVLVDYDRDADFPGYKTYAWLEPVEASLADTDPLMHTRIRNEIELRISEGENALQRVDSDPDIYVTYHAEGQEEVRFSTTSVGYGYGAGWELESLLGGAYGGGMSTTSSRPTPTFKAPSSSTSTTRTKKARCGEEPPRTSSLRIRRRPTSRSPRSSASWRASGARSIASGSDPRSEGPVEGPCFLPELEKARPRPRLRPGLAPGCSSEWAI